MFHGKLLGPASDEAPEIQKLGSRPCAIIFGGKTGLEGPVWISKSLPNSPEN